MYEKHLRAPRRIVRKLTGIEVVGVLVSCTENEHCSTYLTCESLWLSALHPDDVRECGSEASAVAAGSCGGGGGGPATGLHQVGRTRNT